MFGSVTALATTLVPFIAKAFGIDTTTEETKVKLAGIELDAQKLIAEQLTKQAEINIEDARSGDKFQSRWRPFIGWTCGAAFAYHFILQPLLIFIFTLSGVVVPELPQFDMNTLFTVLMGMLGLGAMRTYEKKTR